MKLVTFVISETQADPHIGVVTEDGVVDLTASDPRRFRSMLALIDGGKGALDQARDAVEVANVVHHEESLRLLAPLPRPRQMRDHMAHERHLRQARANRYLVSPGAQRTAPENVEVPQVWYDQPLYYKCNRFAVCGTGTDVLWPAYSRIMDFELELAFVVGRQGHDIAESEARDWIFGYCIFNDFSARDAQMKEMAGTLGPAKGKDFDRSNALGPWLVTADEVPDPYDLTMVARVNGEEWSRGSSATLHHSMERMIAHASSHETLHPGEVFGTGTVGNGCGLELGRFLEHGDVVELEISGLGVLRNRVLRSIKGQDAS